MTEHPTHDPNQETPKKRHLHLVHTEPVSEGHEAQLSLVFFDITDTSFTDEDVSRVAGNIAKDDLNRGRLREYDSATYPKIIARSILEHVHAQPDLDELRELTAKDVESGEGEGELSELDKAQLLRGLEMERLFRAATDVIENAAHTRRTSDLVTELEDFMETSNSYSSNAMRVWSALVAADETAPIKPAVTVAGRVIKTMLYLNAKGTSEETQQ